MNNHEWHTVGRYKYQYHHDGMSIWIEDDEGGGMQIPVAAFESYIEKMFKDLM